MPSQVTKWCPRVRGLSRIHVTLIIAVITTLLLMRQYVAVHRPINLAHPFEVINNQIKVVDKVTEPEEVINFDGFNNETGADHLIVPNIIHYVRFNQMEYSFVDYLCLQAAYRNHRPDYFYIHTNVGDKLKGKYWGWIQKDPDLSSRIRLMPLEAPAGIFGQKFNHEWRFHHGSDVSRLRVLIKYGGIYLDNDVFVIHSLDKYELSLILKRYTFAFILLLYIDIGSLR